MGESLTPLQRALVAAVTLFLIVLVVRAGLVGSGPWGPIEGVGLAVIMIVRVVPRLIEDYLTTTQEGVAVALAGLVCFGIAAASARIGGGQVGAALVVSFVASLVVAAALVCWPYVSDRD